ncbi:hypothetical protein CR513_04627, partial [Mucuna pruriens]
MARWKLGVDKANLKIENPSKESVTHRMTHHPIHLPSGSGTSISLMWLYQRLSLLLDGSYGSKHFDLGEAMSSCWRGWFPLILLSWGWTLAFLGLFQVTRRIERDTRLVLTRLGPGSLEPLFLNKAGTNGFMCLHGACEIKALMIDSQPSDSLRHLLKLLRSQNPYLMKNETLSINRYVVLSGILWTIMFIITLQEKIESLYALKYGNNKLFLLKSIVSLKLKEGASLSNHLN